MQKTTRDYLDEILTLYHKICTFKGNELGELENLRNQYLDFNEKLSIYKIFNELNEEDLSVLKKSKPKNISELHKKLEEIMWFHLTFNIYPSLMAAKSNLEYFLTRVELSRLYFAQKYSEVPHFSYQPGKGRVLNFVKKYSALEIRTLIKSTKEKLSHLKKGLLKDRKLSIKEVKYITSKIEPHLSGYKKEVEKNFFEIRDLFNFYNKEARVYVGGYLRKNSYEISVYLLDSKSTSVYIYPKELAIYSTFDFNNEELDNNARFALMTFLSKVDGKIWAGFLDPTTEALEIFWHTALLEDKCLFLSKLFYLLGYTFEKYDTSPRIFRLLQYNIDIDKPADPKMFSQQQLFVALGNKNYMDDSDVSELIKDVNSAKGIRESKAKIYAIGNMDSSKETKLKQDGILTLNIRDISTLLTKLNLFEFLTPTIKDSILKNKKAKVISELERKRIGDDLIKKLNRIDSGHAAFRDFENLVTEIFHYLFKDSFRTYYAKPQATEFQGHRRRDLVIYNINPIQEFWKSRKIEEKAKRIIVDFKNYSTLINQNVVHDVTKYFNGQMGNFGIIVSRQGVNESGLNEQKLKYSSDNKLVLVLDNKDLVEMIYHKMNNQIIEDIFERKIIELSDN